MQKRFTLSLPQIPDAAKNIAHKLRGGEVLALIGELGSGKTTFTQVLAKRLKVTDKVTSPTFVLMNVFPAFLPRNHQRVILVHIDLFRTKNFKEVKALGLNELWQRKDVVTVIEWADKIKRHLPKASWILNFDAHKNI